MLVGAEANTPVTFCLILNWDDLASDFPAVEAESFGADEDILVSIKRAL